MATRLIFAYGLIAAMVAAVALGTWLLATREKRQRRREQARKVRWQAARAASAPARPDSGED